MPTPPIDSASYANAMNTLTLQAQASVYPTLSGEELDACLQEAMRYTIWQPSTAYNDGDVIRPVIRNGHLYRCIMAWSTYGVQGRSGTTEPYWPLYSNPDFRTGVTRPFWHGYTGPFPGSQVGDGDLQWIESGTDTQGEYDVRGATHRAWLVKAAKSSADYDVVAGKDTYTRSQVVDHCHRMATRYAPQSIA